VSAFLNRPGARFALHYLEMVVVMVVGMGLLALPLDLVVDVSQRPAAMLIEMAFTMTVPMVAWMRLRGHAWRPCNEMAASMVLPTIATLGLLAAAVVTDSGSLMVILHAVMLPSMLVAMLLRRSEYTCAHGHHPQVEAVAA
jgi:hypothetical protein